MTRRSGQLRMLTASFNDVVSRFNRLEERQFDFGTGEKLFSSEIHAIQAIGRESGQTITELGNKFGVTKGAASQLANRLELKGYVIKTRGSENKKEVYLSLSEKGTIAYRSHESMHAKIDRSIIAFFAEATDDDLERFLRFMEKIKDYIDSFS